MPVTERTLRKILTPFEANAIIVLAAHRGDVDEARRALAGRKATLVQRVGEDGLEEPGLHITGQLPTARRFEAAVESARRKIAEHVARHGVVAHCSKHGEYTERGRGCPACSNKPEGGGERPKPMSDKPRREEWPTWAPPSARRPKRKRGEEAREKSEQAARRRGARPATELSSTQANEGTEDVTVLEERVERALQIIRDTPGIRAMEVREQLGVKGPVMSGDIMPRLKAQGVTTGAMVDRSPTLYPPGYEEPSASANGATPGRAVERRVGTVWRNGEQIGTVGGAPDEEPEPDEERVAASRARAGFEVPHGAATGADPEFDADGGFDAGGEETQSAEDLHGADRLEWRFRERAAEAGVPVGEFITGDALHSIIERLPDDVIDSKALVLVLGEWEGVAVTEGSEDLHAADIAARVRHAERQRADSGGQTVEELHAELADVLGQRHEAEERAAALAGEVEELRAAGMAQATVDAGGEEVTRLRTELNTAAESLINARAEVERERKHAENLAAGYGEETDRLHEELRAQKNENATAWENGRRAGVAEGEQLGRTNANGCLKALLYILARDDAQTLASLAVAIDHFEDEREFSSAPAFVYSSETYERLAKALADRVLPLG